jgi:hypothetical protein
MFVIYNVRMPTSLALAAIVVAHLHLAIATPTHTDATALLRRSAFTNKGSQVLQTSGTETTPFAGEERCTRHLPLKRNEATRVHITVSLEQGLRLAIRRYLDFLCRLSRHTSTMIGAS